MRHSIAIFVKNLTSGGAEKQAVSLARVLTLQYDVHFIVLNNQFTHQKYVDKIKEYSQIHYTAFSGSLIQRFFAFIEYLKKNKISLIFSYLTAANFFACLAKFFCKVKVCTGLRNAQLPFAKMVADRFLTNHCADFSVVNCFSGEKNFRIQHFKSSKMVVIPNCYENISVWEEKKHVDIPKIIIVGRFVPQKDYESAIHAISMLKKIGIPFRFEIVGYGEQEKDVRNWIDLYNISDVTEIKINPDNINALLQSADIYLSTSLFEGTSNSIMEAMNANLPIIATNVGDNSYLVKNDENGYLVSLGNLSQIAEKLGFLLKNENVRRNMGQRSKKKLLNDFSTEKFFIRYENLINSLLNGIKETEVQHPKTIS